ncbi:aminodeoxychorismate synthase component I [[Mycobacterium] wendilense]|uniref:Aminodeoxychorismate synthase component I n=1 Tax=[Mycobacterium] wendilense TaxID=3064284 RepID=A0ABN9NV12_9MYCO|nr:aminodeoxychorismate synthase component I [Mycolicibacterium sp. MU0050]CAJ1580247.1 aminodeoxychorismate synthase component I [Mycolicibacterium sp. MU0050]
MRIDRLGALGTTAEVLRAVAAGAARRGLPPPAALTGEWFGARAVIAPSLDVRPVRPGDAFAVGPGGASEAVGGGWFGYLSYPDRAGTRIPAAAGGWTDCVLRCDAAGIWWYESLSGDAAPDWLQQALSTPVAPRGWHITWTAPDRDVHRAGVSACLAAITAGEVYQACVCTQYRGVCTGSPLEFFADAVTRTTPARGAFCAGTWGAVASLSPEVFLRRRGDDISSSPIKGTLPLHADPALLRDSVKDVAENIMIVDLVRNDLGRVATTGSVTVPELLSIRPAPGVWHLVSTVAARVPGTVLMAEVLAATFPPASVTGTPKVRALELLSQWEPQARGVYCGTVGLASPVAGTELNVAIRTVEFDAAGAVVMGVGGGITADSDPDAEWQECLDKAASTLALTGSAAVSAH